MNNKMTIAVDLDGTTGDYEGALRSKLAEILEVSPDKVAEAFPAVTEYDMSISGWFGINNFEDFRDLHSEAVRRGMFEDMKPYVGASEVLWSLHNKGHFIRVVTARFLKPGDRYIVGETTFSFLDKNDIPVDDIAFTARKTEVIADVYIDDSPENITKLRAAGRTVIIFDQPYNRSFDGLRASTWAEVEAIIDSL